MSDFALMNFEEASRSDVLRDAIAAYDNLAKRARVRRWAYIIGGIAAAAILFFVSPPIAGVALIVSLVLAAISGKPPRKQLRSTALGAFASDIGFDYIAQGDGPGWKEASGQFFTDQGHSTFGEMFRKKAAAEPPLAVFRAVVAEVTGGENSTVTRPFSGMAYVLPRSNPGTGAVVMVPRGYPRIGKTAKLQQIKPADTQPAARFDIYATASAEAGLFLENGRFMDAAAQLSQSPGVKQVLIYANPQAIWVAVDLKSGAKSDSKAASGQDLVRSEFEQFSATMGTLKRLLSAST